MPLTKNKKKKVVLIKSIAAAFLLLLFSYIITNVGFVLSGESDLIKQTNSLKSVFVTTDDIVPDSILFVNICYDKELVGIYDQDGFLKGNIDITNRHALNTFLELLSSNDDYKYIMLDVFFEEGMNSNADSALFTKISTMDRIAIANYRDATLVRGYNLEEKSRFSDYTITLLDNDFNKYELLDGNNQSVALTMYEETTGNTIKHLGPFYYDGNHICNRTLFSKQAIAFNSPYNRNGEKNYYNLSTDLLEDPENVHTLTKGKYIFVGDLELDDFHYTVEGRLAGCVIMANTFIALMNGKHKIPISVILILFFTYLIFAYSIFSHQTISELLKQGIGNKVPMFRSPLIETLISWLGYSFILSAICLICYYVYDTSYDIFLTATLLQTIDFAESKTKSNKK